LDKTLSDGDEEEREMTFAEGCGVYGGKWSAAAGNGQSQHRGRQRQKADTYLNWDRISSSAADKYRMGRAEATFSHILPIYEKESLVGLPLPATAEEKCIAHTLQCRPPSDLGVSQHVKNKFTIMELGWWAEIIMFDGGG
jgi:hypothetical protein